MNFGNWTIRAKLGAGFCAVWLIMAIAIYVGLSHLHGADAGPVGARHRGLLGTGGANRSTPLYPPNLGGRLTGGV